MLLCRCSRGPLNEVKALDGGAVSPGPAGAPPPRGFSLARQIGEGDVITIRSDSDATPAIPHVDAALRPALVTISFGFGDLPGEDASLMTNIAVSLAKQVQTPAVAQPIT